MDAERREVDEKEEELEEKREAIEEEKKEVLDEKKEVEEVMAFCVIVFVCLLLFVVDCCLLLFLLLLAISHSLSRPQLTGETISGSRNAGCPRRGSSNRKRRGRGYYCSVTVVVFVIRLFFCLLILLY